MSVKNFFSVILISIGFGILFLLSQQDLIINTNWTFKNLSEQFRPNTVVKINLIKINATFSKYSDKIKNYSELFNLTSAIEINFDEIDPTFAKYPDRVCSFMTFAIYPGRIGNQMFQYASFYGLAKKNKMKPFIPSSDFGLLEAFKLSTPRLKESYFNTSFNGFGESGPYRYNEPSTHLDCRKSYKMYGYRCSWKYFEKYRKEIKKEFEFKTDIKNLCDEALYNITVATNVSQSDCLYIGAHMRRGDFLNERTANWGHVAATGEYLKNAISFFDSRYKSCHIFLIFGDDFEWNLKNAPKLPNVFVMKPHSPYIDFCLLTRCNHNIVSAGSFGWWSAYLAGGDATYMKHQCRPNSGLCVGFENDTYINPKWNWFPV